MFRWTTEHVFGAKSSQEVLYISKELSLLFSQLNLQAKIKNKYGIFKKKKGQFIYKQYAEGGSSSVFTWGVVWKPISATTNEAEE